MEIEIDNGTVLLVIMSTVIMGLDGQTNITLVDISTYCSVSSQTIYENCLYLSNVNNVLLINILIVLQFCN